MGSSLSALSDFSRWVSTGGEQRAGLPTASMSALQAASLNLQAHVAGPHRQLIAVRDQWQQIMGGTDERVSAAVHALLTELYDLSLYTQTMLSEAADIRVKLQDALQLVSLHLDDDQRKLAAAQGELAAAMQHRDQALADLNAAKAELDGGEGFWNGFLTGISLGIYNPVKENIDKANAAVSAYNSACHNIQYQINALNQSQSELSQSRPTLQTLNALDPELAGYQNCLNAAQVAIGKAYTDEEHADTARSPGAVAYYQTCAGKDVDKLVVWIDAFGSAT